MSKNKNLIKIKKPKNINTIFGLPAKTYTDHEFWKKECNTVLSNGWLFVGFVNESIFPKGGIDTGFEFNIMYTIPLVLGIFMILRLVPSLSWLARFSIAYIVGMISGLKLYSFLNSNILDCNFCVTTGLLSISKSKYDPP